MTKFEDFFRDLETLLQKYEQDHTLIKTQQDFENEIIKIFGERATGLAKAKNGISEVTELAYTVAEHHPYWNILYNGSEIINTILEKWKDNISNDDISDIEWAVKEISQSLNKIKETNLH